MENARRQLELVHFFFTEHSPFCRFAPCLARLAGFRRTCTAFPRPSTIRKPGNRRLLSADPVTPAPMGRKPERDWIPPAFTCQNGRFRLLAQGTALLQRRPAWLVLSGGMRVTTPAPARIVPGGTYYAGDSPSVLSGWTVTHCGGGWRFPPSGGHCCPTEDLGETGIPVPWAPRLLRIPARKDRVWHRVAKRVKQRARSISPSPCAGFHHTVHRLQNLHARGSGSAPG